MLESVLRMERFFLFIAIVPSTLKKLSPVLIESFDNLAPRRNRIDSIIRDFPDPVCPVIILSAPLKVIDVSAITAKFLI